MNPSSTAWRSVYEPASVAGVATVQLSAATGPTDQHCASCSSDIWETLAVEDMAEQVTPVVHPLANQIQAYTYVQDKIE